MPLTELDPIAALIIIDLQKGIVAMPLLHPAAEIVGHTADLARAFRQRGWPVALVNVTGMAPGRTDTPRPDASAFPKNWAELVPELDPQPQDILISKQRVGAFHGTALDAELRRRGVTQIFLAGVATTGGVESTGRSASDLGYHVVFVSDAMTDRTEDAHRHSVEKFFPRIGQVETTANVLKLISQGKAAAQ
ncbi:MAG TPA: isochorismatase family protein [Candidatus Acidoferrales bacterium]